MIVPYPVVMGHMLRLFRSRVGLTQQALSDRTNYRQSNFTRLESGLASTNFMIEQLRLFAPHLNLTPEAMFEQIDAFTKELASRGVEVSRTLTADRIPLRNQDRALEIVNQLVRETWAEMSHKETQ